MTLHLKSLPNLAGLLFFGALCPSLLSSASTLPCATWVRDHLLREQQTLSEHTLQWLSEGKDAEIKQVGQMIAKVTLGLQPFRKYAKLSWPEAATYWEPFNPRSFDLGQLDEDSPFIDYRSENRLLRQLVFEAVQNELAWQFQPPGIEKLRPYLYENKPSNGVVVVAAGPADRQKIAAQVLKNDPQFENFARLVWANSVYPVEPSLVMQATGIHYFPVSEELARSTWKVHPDASHIHYLSGPCHVNNESLDHVTNELKGLRPVVESSLASPYLELIRIIVHSRYVYLWDDFNNPDKLVTINDALKGHDRISSHRLLATIARQVIEAALPDESPEEIESEAIWSPRGNLDPRSVWSNNREANGIGPRFVYALTPSKRSARWHIADPLAEKRIEVLFDPS